MWQTDQLFETVGYSFENLSTITMWLETTVAERALKQTLIVIHTKHWILKNHQQLNNARSWKYEAQLDCEGPKVLSTKAESNLIQTPAIPHDEKMKVPSNKAERI